MPLFSFFLDPCPSCRTFDATLVFREHVLFQIGVGTIHLRHWRTAQEAVEPHVIFDTFVQCLHNKYYSYEIDGQEDMQTNY